SGPARPCRGRRVHDDADERRDAREHRRRARRGPPRRVAAERARRGAPRAPVALGARARRRRHAGAPHLRLDEPHRPHEVRARPRHDERAPARLDRAARRAGRGRVTGVLDQAAVADVVGQALREDAPWGDLTCQALVPTTATATAELVAREPGSFAGGAAVAAAFRLTDPTTVVDLLVDDGATVDGGAVLARVSGPAAAVLQAERVAL